MCFWSAGTYQTEGGTKYHSADTHRAALQRLLLATVSFSHVWNCFMDSDFCKQKIKTICHLFFHCKISPQLWRGWRLTALSPPLTLNTSCVTVTIHMMALFNMWSALLFHTTVWWSLMNLLLKTNVLLESLRLNLKSEFVISNNNEVIIQTHTHNNNNTHGNEITGTLKPERWQGPPSKTVWNCVAL